MTEIKRTYNIPLRSWFSKKPKYTRAKVAIRAVKDFLKKHMKSENINLGPKLNEKIWKNGIKNPPHHIKVEVIKNDDGYVTAELFGHKYISNKVEEKKESFKDRLMNKVSGPEKTIVKKVKEDETKDKSIDNSTELNKTIADKKVEAKATPKVEVKTEAKKVEVKKSVPVEKEPLNKSNN